MTKEDELRLSEIACKLSSMTYILHGCCSNYDGLDLNSSLLIEFTKELHSISNELFDLL